MTDIATMRLSDAELAAAQSRSMRNRDRLAGRCGCFHCISTFPAERVRDWIDDGRTALCPVCGIDAVVAEADGGGSVEFLEQMNRRWFRAGTPVTKADWARAVATGDLPRPGR